MITGKDLTKGKIRILAFFNDPIMLSYLNELMSTAEYECILVNAVDHIKVLINQVKPDMVIIDHFLPNLKTARLINELKFITYLDQIPTLFYGAEKPTDNANNLNYSINKRPANAILFIEQVDEIAIQFVIHDENVAFDY